jgi:hypothetical protein
MAGKGEVSMRAKSCFLFFLAIFLISALKVFGQEQASEPVFQEGDFWRFKATEREAFAKTSNPLDGIYECIYSKGLHRMFQVTDDKRELLKPRPWPLLVLFGLYKTQEDLKFPLSVGQKWDYQYRIAERGARREFNRNVQISVTGIEQVTTPAGTFQAFKLEKEDRLGPRDFWLTTYYYSPETKSVIKSFTDYSGAGTAGKREIELIKFGSVRR